MMITIIDINAQVAINRLYIIYLLLLPNLTYIYPFLKKKKKYEINENNENNENNKTRKSKYKNIRFLLNRNLTTIRHASPLYLTNLFINF